EDAAGVDADLTIGIRQARSVAHEPAGFREATKRIYRWDRMSRSQEDYLDPPICEKSTGGHEKHIGLLAHKGREGRIDLAAGGDVENLSLRPDRTSSPFEVP